MCWLFWHIKPCQYCLSNQNDVESKLGHSYTKNKQLVFSYSYDAFSCLLDSDSCLTAVKMFHLSHKFWDLQEILIGWMSYPRAHERQNIAERYAICSLFLLQENSFQFQIKFVILKQPMLLQSNLCFSHFSYRVYNDQTWPTIPFKGHEPPEPKLSQQQLFPHSQNHLP